MVIKTRKKTKMAANLIETCSLLRGLLLGLRYQDEESEKEGANCCFVQRTRKNTEERTPSK